jgi:cis-zeatin O-glucosyltransferase
MEHVCEARTRVHGWGDDALCRIEFHELAIFAYASPPPDPAADLPFPYHLMPLWEAFIADASEPLFALLGEVSTSHRRVVILYDLMNVFIAEEAARLPNSERFKLHCTVVSTVLERMDVVDRLLCKCSLGYPYSHQFIMDEFQEFIGKRSRAWETIRPSSGILMNTCCALEGEFSIGPLNLLLDGSAPEQGKERHECLGGSTSSRRRL